MLKMPTHKELTPTHWAGFLLVGALTLGGCSTNDNDRAVTSVSDAPAAKTTAADFDPNSQQAMRDAEQARESLPGKAHYDTACGMCHEGTIERAPHRQMLVLMTPETILSAMTTGLMQTQASILSDQQKREVAEYLGGRAVADVSTAYKSCTAAPTTASSDTQTIRTQNWGQTLDNKRHLTAAITDVNATNASDLKPLWAFAFNGANRARSQPLFIGDLLVTGSHSGEVLALDANTGCVHWRFQAAAEVRTGIVGDEQSGSDGQLLYFGDVLGAVYAISAATGEERWRTRADTHPNATITGTPSLFEDRLYVPVSALEVSNAIDPLYECCTFRGSVVAMNRATGAIEWQTYTIAEAPTAQGKNASGTTQYGPSGAVIWNSPSIDTKRRRLYVGTGENASSPATTTSDAMMAMNLKDGSIAWSWQGTAQDAWNTACDTLTPDNCPKENGPDYDFGAATLIATNADGVDLVIGGQKSGLVHAINADTGKHLWSTRVGRGGIQGGIHFGIAADSKRIYVPITDMPDGRTYPDPAKPGVHALDINTGDTLWYAAAPDVCAGRAFCHPGVSQSISVLNDLVLAGGMDGVMRGYNSATGKLVYELDTTTPFTTVNGDTTVGGAFGGAAGPIAQGKRVALSSGYGLYNHMPGNLLLMLEY